MNIRHLYILVFCISMVSCNSYKKLTYLRDIEETVDNELHAKQKPPYRIQPADILYVKIVTMNNELNMIFNPEYSTSSSKAYGYREEGLYFSGYTVSDSGFIVLPVVDTVKVVNLTMEEAKRRIEQKTAPYLKDAQIIVRLGNFRFTVLGEVKQPGIKLVHDDQVNIMEAIAYAGDITYNGNRANILIIRPTTNGSRTFRIDATDKDMIATAKYYIMPNDVIYVEPLRTTLFRERTSDYLFVVTALSSTVSAIILVLNFIAK